MDWNPYDAVRGGLTALPNAAAEAAGGLYTRGSGPGQIAQDANGRASVNVVAFGGENGAFAAGRPEVNTTHFGGSGLTQAGGRPEVNTTHFDGSALTQSGGRPEVNTTQIEGSDASNVIKAQADQALADYDPPTNAEFTVRSLPSASYATATALQTVDDNVDAINAKTANLPTDPADQSLILAATDAVMARLGTPAGAGVSADIANVQSDTNDIQSRLPASLTGGGLMRSDTLAINSNAASANNLAKTTEVIGRGTVDTGATTTSIPTSDFTPDGAATDQFKGRIVTFCLDTTTPALRGQSTAIVGSSNAATPTLAVIALTTAPVAGDIFVVT